jgi:hypothetical protein
MSSIAMKELLKASTWRVKLVESMSSWWKTLGSVKTWVLFDVKGSVLHLNFALVAIFFVICKSTTELM